MQALFFIVFCGWAKGVPPLFFGIGTKKPVTPTSNSKNKMKTKKVDKSRKKWHKVVDKTDNTDYNGTDKTDKARCLNECETKGADLS